MTIKEILDDNFKVYYAITGGGTYSSYYKAVDQATLAIKQLVEGMISEEKEVGEMRYGGCNPDEDRGWNACIADLRERMEKL